MLPPLPVEIWNIIFSHFLTGPVRMEVKSWRNGRPSLVGNGLAVKRFLATFVETNCHIKGLYHAAIRFLMTYVHTVWKIWAPASLEYQAGIWTCPKPPKPTHEALEHFAMLQDVFEVQIRAVKIGPYAVYHDKSGVKFDLDRGALVTTIQRLPTLRTLDYSLFPAFTRGFESDSQPTFDLSQMATGNRLHFRGLEFVRCHAETCWYNCELGVRFEFEDAHDSQGSNALSITTQDSKPRVITRLRCMTCLQVLSK
jgi:hypothetical protein